MSLRNKLLLVASVTTAILMLVLLVSANFVIADSYTRFEQQDTRGHVELALNALTSELATLQRTISDYGVWDDTYAFMQDRTPGYLENNYVDGTFINNRLNLVMLVDGQGQPVYTQAFDLDQNQAVPLAAQTRAAILQDAALLQPPQGPTPRFGLIMLPDGPFLIASQSILTSAGDGPARGALIVARALTTGEIAQLSKATKLKLTAIDLRGPLEPEAQAARAAFSDQQPIVVCAVNEQLVQGYALIKDIHDQPALLLRVDLGRSIYQQGQQTLAYMMLARIVVGLVIAVMLVVGLERTVIARLHRLDREVRDIGASTDLTRRVSVQGRDEIGSLSTEINRTLDSLETAQRLLRQREREALDALRFKSQLLAHVSHDLRTPLNAILGYTQMLQAEVYGPVSEQQKEPLMRIGMSCDQLARLINDLLIQSRMEAGRLTLVNQPFALAGLIDAIKTVANPIAQDKHLELRCQIDPAMPAEVQGDYDRLYQVVLNLVDNALKFTEQGAIDLRIERLDAGHYAIVVADTGRGIPLAEQALVFEAFEQGAAPARGRYKGVGLGLSIVKQLTTLMGGQISLASQAGTLHGSTFTVTLPILPAQEEIL